MTDDEMQAIAYLNEIRDVIGGADYEHTVKIAAGLKRMVDEMEDQVPITAVQNDYNADGKSNRIYDYLPAGTQLFASPVPSVPAPAQEPLGYWLTGTDVVEFGYSSYHDGDEWEPLYTTPPAPAQLMTDEQIDSAIQKQANDLLDYIYENGTGCEGITARVRAVARAAIEAAHGITKGNEL